MQEVSEITTGLKALAKELYIPIIALSQLSRQVENREDKRPQLSDLRESGSIEQDADIVHLRLPRGVLPRAHQAGRGHDRVQMAGKMEHVHGKAELIIGKQRHGPIGKVDLQFDGNVTRFSNFAHSGQSEAPPPRPASAAFPPDLQRNQGLARHDE